MTKKFFVFLMGFVLLGAIAFAQTPQTPQDNFNMAGQTELAKREAILSSAKLDIEIFIDSITSDSIISGDEMGALRNAVTRFDKTKEKLDKKLEFYELKTRVDLAYAIHKILNIYYGEGIDEDENTFNNADNNKQDIRRFFTERTGMNIKIEKSKDLPKRLVIGFLFGLIAFILFGILIGAVILEFDKKPCILIGVLALVAMMLIFLLCSL